MFTTGYLMQEKVHEVFYRQLEAASQSQALLEKQQVTKVIRVWSISLMRKG